MILLVLLGLPFCLEGALPLKSAPGGRYLVDQNNQPFLIVGDSPHNLAVGYYTSNILTYFTLAKARSINTIWMQTMWGPYTEGPADAKNVYNEAPFNSFLSGTNYDLTDPNPDYWNRITNVVGIAATNGIQVMLDTLESGKYGYWILTADTNGSNNCYQYGQFFGNTFKGFTNVMWFHGNDMDNEADDQEDMQAIAAGIRSVDTNFTRLNTVMFMPPSLSWEAGAPFEGWRNTNVIQLNGVYTYFVSYDYALRAWATNIIPSFQMETCYEGESNAGGDGGTANNIRRQMYWSVLSGSLGGWLHGSKWVWVPLADWSNTLATSQSYRELSYMGDVLTNRTWYSLVPDQTHKLVTAGYGTKASGEVLPEDSDYVTAAVNTNGTLGMAYTPVAHTLTVAMTNFVGSVTSRWFDPTTNTFTTITGSPFANTITTNLTTPGNNAAGDGDWVLLLESGSGENPPTGMVSRVSMRNVSLRGGVRLQ